MSQFAYPRRARLRSDAELRRHFAACEVFPGREGIVRRRANALGHPRLGTSAPRAYGSAVRRNRFRRLVREAFRGVQAELGAYDFHVVPRRALEQPTLAGLRHDLLRCATATAARRRR